MNPPNLLPRQAHRLLQLGIALLLFTSFEGFAVPYLSAPHLGRSVHTLCGLSAILMVALGLMWSRLELGVGSLRIAFWFLCTPTWRRFWPSCWLPCGVPATPPCRWPRDRRTAPPSRKD